LEELERVSFFFLKLDKEGEVEIMFTKAMKLYYFDEDVDF